MRKFKAVSLKYPDSYTKLFLIFDDRRNSISRGFRDLYRELVHRHPAFKKIVDIASKEEEGASSRLPIIDLPITSPSTEKETSRPLMISPTHKRVLGHVGDGNMSKGLRTIVGYCIEAYPDIQNLYMQAVRLTIEEIKVKRGPSRTQVFTIKTFDGYIQYLKDLSEEGNVVESFETIVEYYAMRHGKLSRTDLMELSQTADKIK